MSTSSVRTLSGIPASPGIAIGPAFLLDRQEFRVQERDLAEGDVEREVDRFQEAIVRTRDDLIVLQERIAGDVGEEIAHIFGAHLTLLDDPEMVGATIARIRRERKNAEWVFNAIMQRGIATMAAATDPYLRERTADFEDIRHRVLAHLRGEQRLPLADLTSPVIVVAHHLSPSDTAEMHRDSVLGFVTDGGGRTAHAAIVARGLAIPAVVGVDVATREIEHGSLIIVDGNDGAIYLNPDEDTLRRFEEARTKQSAVERGLTRLKDLPAVTPDGHAVDVSANIELPSEIDGVLSSGAVGVGLYRTEFLYILRPTLPTEEEQYASYWDIAQRLAPKPVIIRTLDLGTDKVLHQLDLPHEANPALGYRGIRICLERPDLFKAQLRAILRASTMGNLRIMFPMISGLAVLRHSKQILDEARAELDGAGIPYDRSIPVGMMIEVPSAALIARDLAREVDFFSIGTNDLIQYTLAVDRSNAKIAAYYDPFNPAILRLIASVVEAGHHEGLWVGVCGEMAGDPITAFLLLGLGVDELSMSTIDIPEIKKIIRSVTFSKAQAIAQYAVTLSTSKDIQDYTQAEFQVCFKNAIGYE
ncbi:MAG: phosphoenolpyruvate--protein phosphotransferase [Candidatus Latescibacteria bacterium]|nr:phosphoenolpyruvate--protein phosphotransferase [Candidatus Latescibacterota bacterium]